ncbi:MAG TPA: ATP-binding protein [Actinomycetes bacterium]
MPIRLRLVLVVTAAAVVLAVVGVLVGSWGLRVSLVASIDQGLRQASQPIAEAVSRREDSGGGGGGSGRGRGGGSDDRQRRQEAELEVKDIKERIDATPDTPAQVLNPAGAVVAASSGLGNPTALVPPSVRAGLSGARLYDQTVGPRGEPLRVLATPVQRADGRYVVAVGSSLATADDAVRRVRQGALIAGIALVIGSSLGAWLLAGAALRPVERLRAAVAAVPPDQPGRPLDVPGTRDELAALARTMNELLDRISQALERERRLIADASHELRTPLTVLRTELELADRAGRSREQLAESVHHATLEATRIARLAEDLLLLARTDRGAPVVRAVDQPLEPVLQEAVASASIRARDHEVRVGLQVEPELVAAVDGDRLRQAVDNLLDNALRVAPAGSEVRLEAGRRNGTLEVSVSDRGPGFPAGFLPHAFERFHRADTARTRQHGGAGLGLAIVNAIAHGHGGRAEAANRRDGGAVVRILLPAP